MGLDWGWSNCCWEAAELDEGKGEEDGDEEDYAAKIRALHLPEATEEKLLKEVSHLPKLREHFAEFLQHRSPIHLGILYLSTCVGFWYGLRRGYFPRHITSKLNPLRTH